MMSGWFIFGPTLIASLMVFLYGRRLSRATVNPFAGKRMLGLPMKNSHLSAEQIRWVGRLFILVAVLMLLPAAALSFGLVGPVSGIEPIEFGL